MISRYIKALPVLKDLLLLILEAFGTLTCFECHHDCVYTLETVYSAAEFRRTNIFWQLSFMEVYVPFIQKKKINLNYFQTEDNKEMKLKMVVVCLMLLSCIMYLLYFL